jgi:hypothetical protein
MGSVEVIEKSAYAEQLERFAALVRALPQNRTFSSQEVERFAYDLRQLEGRLKGREYLRTSFKPRSVMSIPERTQELFNDLEFYASMGRIWQGLLERALDSSEGIVAEVGCGPVPKVGIGLHYAGFTGTCHLLDIDPKAGQMSCEYLTMLGARYTRVAVSESLFDPNDVKYTGLFANHLIDDLILHTHCQTVGICIDDLYNDEGLYQRVWEDAAGGLRQIAALMERFIRAVFAKTKPGGVVLLLDYPSFSHRALGLGFVTECVRRCQGLLRELIGDLGGVMLDSVLSAKTVVGRIELDPENLLAFRKSKEAV